MRGLMQARSDADAASRPELDLLLACAQVAPGSGGPERVRRAQAASLDWPRLLQVGSRPGMLPLLAHHLRGHADLIPPKEFERLGRYALLNASTVLMRTRELLQLLEMFGGAGILAVPYKGQVLAQQLYGNLALRQAGDIDLLIRKDDVPRSREVLLAAGYKPFRELSPAKTEFRLKARYCEDYVTPQGVHLEVHWAFTNKDVAFPLTLEDMAPRLGSVSVGQHEAPVFSPEDLLLILTAHGAKHRWDRLEWICGVSELLRRYQEVLDWPTALDRARKLYTRRTLLLGLLVAHDLLGAPVPEQVLKQARADRWIVRLAADVDSRLHLVEMPTNEMDEMLSQNLFQLPLQDRLADRFRFLLYRLTTPSSPDNWQTYSVGGVSVHLHSLTWPLRLGAKLVKRPLGFLTRRDVAA